MHVTKQTIDLTVDCVHLFGSSGRKAYTESVMMILRETDSIKKAPPTYFRRYHLTSPQESECIRPGKLIEGGYCH